VWALKVFATTAHQSYLGSTKQQNNLVPPRLPKKKEGWSLVGKISVGRVMPVQQHVSICACSGVLIKIESNEPH
jgi:hypothetical protein